MSVKDVKEQINPSVTLNIPPKNELPTWNHGEPVKNQADESKNTVEKTSAVRLRTSFPSETSGVTSKARVTSHLPLPPLRLQSRETNAVAGLKPPSPTSSDLTPLKPPSMDLKEENSDVDEVRLRTHSPHKFKVARVASDLDLKTSWQNLSKVQGRERRASDAHLKKPSELHLRRPSDAQLRRISDKPIARNREGTSIVPPKRKGATADGSKTDRGARPHSGDRSPRTITVPLSFFIRQIDKSVCVISHDKWVKNITNSIALQVSDPKFFVTSREKIIGGICEHLLDDILKRIDFARVLLLGVKCHSYLCKFPMTITPLQFWKNYETLRLESSQKWGDLYEIMGGHESTTILQKTVKAEGNAIRKKIEVEMALLQGVEKKKKELIKTSFSFLKNFDVNNLHIVPIPIYLLDFKEFEESFRAFYSDGPFPEDCIRINGKNLILPNYKELGVDEDRSSFFFKWLLGEMQARMQVSSSRFSEAEQITLFAEEWDGGTRVSAGKLKEAISKRFKKEFKSNYKSTDIPAKLDHCFKKLKKLTIAEDFVSRMAPHSPFISAYLLAHKGFKSLDWDVVAYDLTCLCRRFHLFGLKYEKIALLAVLKSMCYASYSTAELFMRTHLCPDLFKKESPYHLVLDHARITQYDIWCKSDTFETTHIKAFKIFSDEKSKASIEVCWRPKGKLGQIEYASSLTFSKIDYDPDCPSEERKKISDLFNLDVQSSFWGKYLQLESTNDFLFWDKTES